MIFAMFRSLNVGYIQLSFSGVVRRISKPHPFAVARALLQYLSARNEARGSYFRATSFSQKLRGG